MPHYVIFFITQSAHLSWVQKLYSVFCLQMPSVMSNSKTRFLHIQLCKCNMSIIMGCLLIHFLPVFFFQQTLSSVPPNYAFQPVDSSDSMRNCGLLTVMPYNDTCDPQQLCAWVLLHLCSSMHHEVETGPHHHCTSANHTNKNSFALVILLTSRKVPTLGL
jgi:hypothetical protein